MAEVIEGVEKSVSWIQRINNFFRTRAERRKKVDDFFEQNANLGTRLDSIEKKLSSIQERVKSIEEDQTILQSATCSELCHTLDNYYRLFQNRGWCSLEEKRAVQAVYDIYSGPKLNGNGIGKKHYEEIMSLPESPKA